jgi:hemerythrin-like domain-containing protein
MQEHRIIEQALDALDRFGEGLTDSNAENRNTTGRFVEFFRTYADRHHHGKEEDLLFREMERHGFPAGDGPVAVMLQEHDMGRALVGQMETVARGEGPLSDEERSRVRSAAADFSMLLRQHIEKEDAVLYPMALKILPPGIVDELAAAFEAFDKKEMGGEAHERMKALADSLAAEVKK